MVVYNQEKTRILTEYDLDKGYLKEDEKTTLIPAVKGVKEEGHFVIIARYPNGGKDVEYVIDTPAVQEVAEHVEKETVVVYVPYTEEELRRRTAQRQIDDLKRNLSETDYKAIKYAEGIITEGEYAPTKAQRQKWRNEINDLENQIGGDV